jgi:methionyl-tRNA formyltransferase
MRAGIIGAVRSTETTLRLLVEHGFNIVGVLGYSPDNKENTSGWTDLKKVSEELNVPYSDYKQINEQEHLNWMKKAAPDIIFAVGFSQLLSDEWLNMPKLGCIGFHPTYLPQGRGRAPLAWIILEERKGAATFFLMDKDADSGPVFVQELFDVEENDDATSVGRKISESMRKALCNWLPRLKRGEWDPVPQEEALATWYGKRTPSDGIIHWEKSAKEIDLLIKSATHPHPGAYTFFKDTKLIIWASEVEKNIPIKGVAGRILLCKDSRYLVQCGSGLIWLKQIDGVGSLKVGDKLGYNIENEIYNIKNKLSELYEKNCGYCTPSG